jgi:LacI family transcriptional regulator
VRAVPTAPVGPPVPTRAAGGQSLTIEEIAELASVSRSTVSRVLNDHPSVRPDVRARVQQVIHEHRYTPSAAARSLASRRSNLVGLLIPRSTATIFADPFFSHVIQGITETCNNRGYLLMLAMVTAEREQDFYERVLRGRHVDGLIMLASDVDDPILPQLIRDATQLVLVGRHPYLRDVRWVDTDNVGGAVLAVQHLTERGYQRIAWRSSSGRNSVPTADLGASTDLRAGCHGGRASPRSTRGRR